MPRAKRKPKKKLKVIEKEDSDVDAGHDTPDPESEEFFYDDVDKFHTNREKILLDRSLESSGEESEGFEQVEDILGLDIESDEDDDDDEIQVPEESLASSDEDMEKGIPSEKAWGKKKKVYYDADQYKDKDLDSEEEEALDNEEEEEVLMLQQNMAARLDEDDFDMEEFELTSNEVPGKQKAKVEKTQQEKITMDLSKLSKEEKIKLLTKDSPELFELMGDFKEKLIEVEEHLLPLVQMARAGKITNPQGVEYLEMKHQLIMNYLVNVCFYLLLKAHQTPVKNHPVIERLVEYRELLQQMEALDIRLNDDIEYFLQKYKENGTGETLNDFSKHHELNNKQGQKKKVIKKKVKFSKSKSASEVQSDEVLPSASAGEKRKKLEDLDPLSYYEAIRDMKKKRKEERMKSHLMSMKEDVDNIDDEADEEIDGKRGITYQISKNKGLTPKRKKEVRNPRLKHRKKYVKAKIKRKSQINPVVKELSRYGGEETGIKTHLTRSIKIK